MGLLIAREILCLSLEEQEPAQGNGPAIVLTNPLQEKPSSLCTVTAIICVFLLFYWQGEALVEVKPFLVIFPNTNP